MDIKTIQKQHREWSEYNFGVDKDPVDAYWGIVEEKGEISHALLKMKQKIRGSVFEHEEELIDGVADMAIYCIEYANIYKIDLSEKVTPAPYLFDKETDDPIYYLERLTVKLRKNIDNGSNGYHTRRLFYSLIYLCEEILGIDFESAFTKTFENVMARDWKKYKFNGVSE